MCNRLLKSRATSFFGTAPAGRALGGLCLKMALCTWYHTKSRGLNWLSKAKKWCWHCQLDGTLLWYVVKHKLDRSAAPRYGCKAVFGHLLPKREVLRVADFALNQKVSIKANSCCIKDTYKSHIFISYMILTLFHLHFDNMKHSEGKRLQYSFIV